MTLAIRLRLFIHNKTKSTLEVMKFVLVIEDVPIALMNLQHTDLSSAHEHRPNAQLSRNCANRLPKRKI